LGGVDVEVGRVEQLEEQVSVVASPIANGTFRIRASVRASSVLPQPVGPSSRMFDLSTSTSDPSLPSMSRL
jgi:hypothetical protein